MLSQIGLAAGAAGWKSAHIAVLSGELQLTRDYPAGLPYGGDEPKPNIERSVEEFAAREARAYMREVVCPRGVDSGSRCRVFTTYMYAFLNGALDAASQTKPQFH